MRYKMENKKENITVSPFDAAKTPSSVKHTEEEIERNKTILLGLGFYKKANGPDKEQFIYKADNLTIGRTFSKDYPAGKFWAAREGNLSPSEKFLKEGEVKELTITKAFYAIRDKGANPDDYVPVYKNQEIAQEITQDIVQNVVHTQQTPENIIVEADNMAIALYHVVEKQKLYTQIGAKKYLHLEAWQLLGRFSNVHGIVEDVKPVEYFGVNGFRAKAVIKDSIGTELSSAEAVCMTDEELWQDKPVFQLMSMAQTRALSKAYRIALSFIVSIAGYSPTPYEEM
jgi:hypothetical protein